MLSFKNRVNIPVLDRILIGRLRVKRACFQDSIDAIQLIFQCIIWHSCRKV